MKNLLLTIRKWLDWRKRVSGKDVIDWTRGCGYYLSSYKWRSQIGKTEILDLQSGKRGVYKLLNIDFYIDPPDMVHKSYWQLVGYEHQKPFFKMSFREFVNARSD